MTILDSRFLPQGLSLYYSLQRHVEAFRLWMICMDSDAERILARLALPNVQFLSISAVADEELLRATQTRSRAESCWTVTPFSPELVQGQSLTDLRQITYVDADLYLLRNPQPIFDEFALSGASALLTEHAYSPEFDDSDTLGRFCVQFMTFRLPDATPILRQWQSQCIDWCSATPEGGRFGDQKYLDSWPMDFPELVHILNHREWVLGPWNAYRFPFSEGITYHMQGLRILSRNRIHLSDYPVPDALIRGVYEKYASDLRQAMQQLQEVGYEFEPQSRSIGSRILRPARVAKRLWKRYRSPDELFF